MAMAAVDRRVAMITGGGRGIGRATAQAFVAAGYAVVIAEVQPALGRRAAHALRARGAEAVALATDVARRASVRRAVAATRSRFGRIDCLVNNAGVLTVGPLVRLADARLDRMLDVNLRGPLLMTRAVLPGMLRRASGVIVNVASLLGRTGAADYATYCATKFGVVGFTEALAEELRGTGVRVWAVCPGLVDTPMARKTGVTARERSRLIRPESVARVVVDLATGRRREPSGAAVEVTR
jgi:meso-butanediol dehydrogenase/(S,S)-butanediol dehydrogenase/diacetyl reductase